MPLDPQAELLLKGIAVAGHPPISEGTPEEARAAIRLLAALGGEPAERADTEDRAVPGPAGDIPVRIYRPRVVGPLPAVVYFHGGGWMIGDIDTHDLPCHNLAVQTPAIVVSVDYRLAPEHRFPAAPDDCTAATAWVAANAAALGASNRLAVAGDSAGGNLAAVVARRARDAGSPAIALQVLMYPGLDMTRSCPSHRQNGEGYLLTAKDIDWFVGSYVGPADQRHPDASPMWVEDLAGLPPALVITAEYDPLRDEGERYAERLRAAGVDAVTSRYDGMIHGFFGMDALFDASKRATAEAAAALHAALAG